MFESVEAGLVGEVSGDSPIRVQSPLSYSRTVDVLGLLIEATGLKVEAHIDHMSRLQSVDGQARPKSFFLLGEGKACSGSVVPPLINGLGLSLSFIVFEDERKCVWVTYKGVELPCHAADRNEHDSLANGVANLMDNITSDLTSISQVRAVH